MPPLGLAPMFRATMLTDTGKPIDGYHTEWMHTEGAALNIAKAEMIDKPHIGGFQMETAWFRQ